MKDGGVLNFGGVCCVAYVFEVYNYTYVSTASFYFVQPLQVLAVILGSV